MNNILILYPPSFHCFSKFNRKVSRIVENMDDYSATYPDDPNDFISSCLNKNTEAELIKETNWDVKDITHAIIFDDGEEFPNEIEVLKNSNIPLRIIKIAITRVINIKYEPQYKNKKSTTSYEYIGRGSCWGNPYSMYENGDGREEVIRKYKYDFDHELIPNSGKSEIYKLAGKRLGCFCKPQHCHGDVLANFLNRWDDEK